MADKKILILHILLLIKIFREYIGETADFSGAMYNGDFSMTLEQAQRKNMTSLLTSLVFIRVPGFWKWARVGDHLFSMPPNKEMLKILGLTLSDGQYNACTKKDLSVRIKDCRTVKPKDFGTFDAVVSVGAFEHFCSLEEYKAGKQAKVYNDFLKPHPILYQREEDFLQTMILLKK